MTRFLGRDDLFNRGIPYSDVQLARLEKSGQFPRRVPIGANRVGWIEAEIEGWIKSRIQARDAAVEPAA
jgi:prophage regulatory protein